MSNCSHKELVEIAYRWLLKNGRVGVAFKELVSASDEIPDIIGFDSWQSILIECKISRNDFFSDFKKPHRNKGMGKWRFYCVPKGMITKNELPPKWGLIYVENNKARIEYDCRVKEVLCKPFTLGGAFGEPLRTFTSRTETAEENIFEVDLISERRIMYSALRRLFIKGYVKHIYDKKYNNRSVNDVILLNE